MPRRLSLLLLSLVGTACTAEPAPRFPYFGTLPDATTDASSSDEDDSGGDNVDAEGADSGDGPVHDDTDLVADATAGDTLDEPGEADAPADDADAEPGDASDEADIDDTPPPDAADPTDADPPSDSVDDTAADPDGDTTTPAVSDFVVLTFNVARYFDTACDSGSCGGDAFEAQPSAAQFRFRTEQLAAAIAAADADIVLLQEVETLDCLDALRAALPAPGYPVFIHGETFAPGSLDTAVLARTGTLLRADTHGDRVLRRPDGSRTSFARELLEIHLGVPEGRIIVFNAHFKSKSDDDPGRRFAEAQATAEIAADAAERYPEATIIVGGDLNDTPGSAPIDALEQGGVLLRAGSLLPPADDWTHVYRSERNALDHLFLHTAAGGRFNPDDVRVLRDATGAFGGSDHAALVAGFLWR